jgi:hypothetical protein
VPKGTWLLLLLLLLLSIYLNHLLILIVQQRIVIEIFERVLQGLTALTFINSAWHRLLYCTILCIRSTKVLIFARWQSVGTPLSPTSISLTTSTTFSSTLTASLNAFENILDIFIQLLQVLHHLLVGEFFGG